MNKVLNLNPLMIIVPAAGLQFILPWADLIMPVNFIGTPFADQLRPSASALGALALLISYANLQKRSSEWTWLFARRSFIVMIGCFFACVLFSLWLRSTVAPGPVALEISWFFWALCYVVFFVSLGFVISSAARLHSKAAGKNQSAVKE